jgi:Ca2+-binding EF-hand superfamily protein
MGAGAAGAFVSASLPPTSDAELKATLQEVPKELRQKIAKAIIDSGGVSNGSYASTKVDSALADLFSFYDLQRTGYITIDEMLAVDREYAKVCGIEFKEEDTRASFKDSDANKDGKVAMSEFIGKFRSASQDAGILEDAMIGMVGQTLNMLKKTKPVMSLDDAITGMFEIYDLDKSGFITIDEIVKMDKVVSETMDTPFDEAETRSNFTESDANKDNKVSLSEYKAYFKTALQKTGLPESTLLGMVKQTNMVLLKNEGKWRSGRRGVVWESNKLNLYL